MQDRLDRLRERMRLTGTNLVAVGPTSHMRWLAGVDPHGDERMVLLLVSQTHAGFLMPALNQASVRQMTDLPFVAWSDDDGPTAALRHLLDLCGLPSSPKVALDEAMRADFALPLLTALGNPEWRFCHDTVGHLRARKDADEIVALTASARLNDRAVQAAFAAVRPGMTEGDVARIIHDHYAAHGARPEFTIVAFGPNGAFPHHHTGDTQLTDDCAILIDTGCRLGGYPSDMTRCAWFGTSPSDMFQTVASIVERAVTAGLAAARPGGVARDVDKAARDVIEAEGYGGQFLHRTGHGLGIDVHEPPWITATSESLLDTGMVFSIEPGIYLGGDFGLRLEDIVVVDQDGARPLSDLPLTPVILPPS